MTIVNYIAKIKVEILQNLAENFIKRVNMCRLAVCELYGVTECFILMFNH